MTQPDSEIESQTAAVNVLQEAELVAPEVITATISPEDENSVIVSPEVSRDEKRMWGYCMYAVIVAGLALAMSLAFINESKDADWTNPSEPTETISPCLHDDVESALLSAFGEDNCSTLFEDFLARETFCEIDLSGDGRVIANYSWSFPSDFRTAPYPNTLEGFYIEGTMSPITIVDLQFSADEECDVSEWTPLFDTIASADNNALP